jgi:hypothetical protein
MAKHQDSQPTQPFQSARELLRAHLADIASGKPRLDQAAIVYRVSGGPPGTRLETTLRVSSVGEMTFEHVDELRGERQPRIVAKISLAEAMRIFRDVSESQLLDQDDTGGGFLPDSVIGSVSVESSAGQVAYHFLADEQQRRWQHKELPAAVRKLKPALDSLCAQLQTRRRRRKA